MASKGYSAGTIFLQVVPVFGDLVKDIQKKTDGMNEALGAEMEKAGKEAGKKAGKAIAEETAKASKDAGKEAGDEYQGAFAESFRKGIQKLEREIKPIKIKTGSDDVFAELDKIKAQMKALGDIKIDADFNPRKAMKAVAEVMAAVKALKASVTDIDVSTNLDESMKGFEAFIARIEKAHPTVVVEMDTRAIGYFESRLRKSAKNAADSLGDAMNPRITQIKNRLGELADVDITPDIDGERLRQEVANLSRELQLMARDRDANVFLRADVGDAYLALKGVNTEASLLDGKHIDVTLALHQDPERSIGAFEKQVRKTATDAADKIDGSLSPTMARIRKQLSDLSNEEITPTLNAREVRDDIANLSRELIAIDKDITINADIRFEARKALAELLRFNQAANKIDGRNLDVDIDLDAKPALTGLRALQARLLGAGANGDGAANSFRAFNFVILGAAAILPALVPAVAALGGALLALLPILAAVGSGVGVMIAGFSGIGGAVSALGAVQDSAGEDSKAAAEKIRGAAEGIKNAEQSLADARRNAARSNADAVRAEVDARRNAASAIQAARANEVDAAKSAAQANADAARAVADARRSAADAIQSALDQQRDAQEAYRDAVAEVQAAEQNLADARRAGYAEIDDTKDAVKQNALDERAGVVDVFEATVNYETTMADGAATNLDKEQASIALEQARLSLEEVRETEKELAKERAKQRKEGVSGTDAVETAQDQLTAALDAQKDAQEAVGEAAAAVNQARIDGARAVADAVRAQQQTEADGAASIADAAAATEQARIDGARAIADAERNSARTREDGARSVADAQDALADANRDAKQTITELGTEGSAAMQELEKAMGALGPEGRKFALYLFSLREGFYDLRRAIQESMLPPIQRAIQTIISKYGPGFEAFAVRMGATVGGLFERSAREFAYNPVWQEFFATMSKIGPGLVEEFGITGLNWMQVFANLMTIAAPYAERLSAALLAMSDRAAKFTASAEGTRMWTRFLDYAFKVGPMVADFFWALARALINLAEGLAPLGAMVLKVLDAFANWLADMDPKMLGIIATAVIGLVIAFQVAVGAVALLASGTSVLLSPLASFVFFAGAAVVALIALYNRFDAVKAVVDIFVDALSAAFDFVLQFKDEILAFVLTIGAIVTAVMIARAAFAAWTFVMGAFRLAMLLGFGPLILIVVLIAAVVAAVVYAYKRFPEFRRVVDAALHAAGATMKWLWEKVVKPVFKLIWEFIKVVFKGIMWAWENVLKPVFTAIFAVLRMLWNRYVQPILTDIGEKWDALMIAMKVAWNKYLKPVFDAIVDRVLPRVKDAFETAVDKIGDAWNKLKEIVAAPINFVIGVINDGLIDGFNKIAKFVNSDEMEHIPTVNFARGGITPGGAGAQQIGMTPAGGFARGGIAPRGAYDIYPGYTPGRDTGYIGIGGGEAIMRPEWTKAVEQIQPGFVSSMNAAARSGGVGAIKRMLGGAKHYADGGVVGPQHRGNFFLGGVTPLQAGVLTGNHGAGYYGASFAGDLNGPLDLASPPALVYSWKPGVVASLGYGTTSYGNHVRINHAGQSTLYAHLSSIMASVGQQVKGGTPIGRVGSTGNSTGAHLHFEVRGGNVALGDTGTSGAGQVAAEPALPGWLQKIVSGTVGWVRNKVEDGTEALKSRFGGGGFIDLVAGIPLKLIDSFADKIDGMVSGYAPPGALQGPVANIPASGPVAKQVRQVAQQYGWGSGAQWASLSALIAAESSWNPNAQNPSTSAAGLFQKMTSLHGPLESTAGGQAAWGLNYIKNRYGTPVAAWNFHRANNYYADGGIVGEDGGAFGGAESGSMADNGTMMYDNGGYLPPGLTTVLNLTGKPEPVFTADQFERMGSGGAGGGFTYAPTITEANLTSDDLAKDVMFTFRRLSRGGKHAGSR